MNKAYWPSLEELDISKYWSFIALNHIQEANL